MIVFAFVCEAGDSDARDLENSAFVKNRCKRHLHERKSHSTPIGNSATVTIAVQSGPLLE